MLPVADFIENDWSKWNPGLLSTWIGTRSSLKSPDRFPNEKKIAGSLGQAPSGYRAS